MVGNWRFNVFLGTTAFLFTYFISFSNNTWQTSFFRAFIGFLLFFIFGYLFRFLFHQIVSKNGINSIHNENSEKLDKQESITTNDIEESHVANPMFQSLPLHSLHNGVRGTEPEKTKTF